MTEHIPIFCATDENYAPFTSLMMKSMLMHTNSFIDFYIMDGGIKEKTKKLINKDLKKYLNKKITYIDMGMYDLNRFPCTGKFERFSANTFARYFVPEIVPNLEKVIYMDVDIIVKKDIAELYHQDMKNFPIGATPCDFNENNGMMQQVKNICPDVNVESVAFNAGILLMNIPKLIQMDYTNQAIRLTEIFADKLVFPDQDILNIIFENNYLPLDYRFDFIHSTLPRIRKYKTGIKIMDPIMIHYTTKPWNLNVYYQNDFEEILRDSVFYKLILRKWRSRRVSYYLFGFIPIFKKYVPKDIFANQYLIEGEI